MFVEITQQCFALLPQVNFPANNVKKKHTTHINWVSLIRVHGQLGLRSNNVPTQFLNGPQAAVLCSRTTTLTQSALSIHSASLVRLA